MPRRSTRMSAHTSSPTRDKKRPLEAASAAHANHAKLKRTRNNPRPGRKSYKSSPTKSKYFHPDAQDTSSDDLSSKLSEPEASDDAPERNKGGKSASAAGLDLNTAGSTNSDAWGKASGHTKGTELWREGVRTGLGPGKEVFIELPKARDPGDIPYEDRTIHPNTLLFLKDLKENNNRTWFKMHEADYRASKKDWEIFVESFTEKISEKDSTIPELPAKDLVFRIHRDIRFSKDQTPYKQHFSAAWSRTGKKGKYAAYYLHLQPENCFIAAGVWMPEEPRLSQLRADVDRNSDRIKQILNDEDLRREFLNGIPSDERMAVKEFVSQNQETALKTKPKGYPADHRDIELLRLRSYTLSKKLRDEELLGPDAQDRLAHLVGILVPFVTWINSVVMPDPNDDDSGDEEEGDSDQEEDEA
ncbi:hypothetical protein VTO42DRAFT_7382 [Malbranchea cinnamomea]